MQKIDKVDASVVVIFPITYDSKSKRKKTQRINKGSKKHPTKKIANHFLPARVLSFVFVEENISTLEKKK